MNLVVRVRNSLNDKARRLRLFLALADNRSGGALSILKTAGQHFGEMRAAEAAASVAFWAFFSLFPLLLFLVAVGSLFLASEQVYVQIVAFVGQIFPASQDLIQQNIQQVLALRGPVGLIGLVGLLWSASEAFDALSRHINRAWSAGRPRAAWQYRLFGLGMIGVLAGLLILWLLSTAAANLLAGLQIPLGGSVSIYETTLWKILSGLVPAIFTFLMFLNLYRWVPHTRVKWSQAMWGALVAAAAWQLAAIAFAWFLRSGLAQYQLIYGSLGTVVALMLWIYLCCWITLFGAHLSAATGLARKISIY